MNICEISGCLFLPAFTRATLSLLFYIRFTHNKIRSDPPLRELNSRGSFICSHWAFSFLWPCFRFPFWGSYRSRKGTTRFLLMFGCGNLPLVGPSGLEPPTSCLSGTRSNLLSYDPSWLVKWLFTRLRIISCAGVGLNSPIGGDDGIRTHDPLLAGQVLSQLSYTPNLIGL